MFNDSERQDCKNKYPDDPVGARIECGGIGIQIIMKTSSNT